MEKLSAHFYASLPMSDPLHVSYVLYTFCPYAAKIAANPT